MNEILDWLADHPGSSGAEISKGIGMGSGRLYCCLHEGEKRGVLVSEWAQPEPRADEKPRRRLYWLSDAALASPPKE